MKQIQQLWADENGATAVEYGLMVAAIAAVIIAVVFSVGTKVNGAFTTVDTQLP
jgi:pilus assembly protein Flp/PilA